MKVAGDWKKFIPWDEHKWAQYACLTVHGTIKLYRDKPHWIEMGKKIKFWWPRYCERTYATNTKLKGHAEYVKMKSKNTEGKFMYEWESIDTYTYQGKSLKNTLITRKGKKE